MPQEPKSAPKKPKSTGRPRTQAEWNKYWVSQDGDLEILNFTPTGKPLKDEYNTPAK